MFLLIVDGGIYPCTPRMAQEARHTLGFLDLRASSFDEALIRGVLHPSSTPEARSCFRDWIISGQEVLPKPVSVLRTALAVVLAVAAFSGVIAWGGEVPAGSTGLWLVATAVYLAAGLVLPAGWLVIAAQSGARRFLLRRFYRRNRGAPRLCPSEAFLELGHMGDLAHVPPEEFRRFLLENREALELLGCAGKVELPELERQALLAKIQSSLRRRAIAAEASIKARQELDQGSYLREVHRVLGWTPEEAEVRRELDSLQ